MTLHKAEDEFDDDKAEKKLEERLEAEMEGEDEEEGDDDFGEFAKGSPAFQSDGSVLSSHETTTGVRDMSAIEILNGLDDLLKAEPMQGGDEAQGDAKKDEDEEPKKDGDQGEVEKACSCDDEAKKSCMKKGEHCDPMAKSEEAPVEPSVDGPLALDAGMVAKLCKAVDIVEASLEGQEAKRKAEVYETGGGVFTNTGLSKGIEGELVAFGGKMIRQTTYSHLESLVKGLIAKAGMSYEKGLAFEGEAMKMLSEAAGAFWKDPEGGLTQKGNRLSKSLIFASPVTVMTEGGSDAAVMAALERDQMSMADRGQTGSVSQAATAAGIRSMVKDEAPQS